MVVVALAEAERVTAAVGDDRQANTIIEEEDAVPGHTAKSRGTARINGPAARVAGITGHPIETPVPRGANECAAVSSTTWSDSGSEGQTRILTT
jgi:hypothetical protein